MDFPVNPTKLALINVDMQNCFVENSPIAAPEGRALVDRINPLIKTCRTAGVLIIHTSHVIRPDRSNIGVMGEIIPSENTDMIRKGMPSAELHDQLNVADGDVLLDKPRFGSFHGTDLELILRARGIDTIIVSGICTNICCETTAREANVRDFRVFFLTDGTATFAIDDLSAEDVQNATCATLGFAFAQLSTVDEMIARVETTQNNT
jgi:nicotinamidase-related amidase